MYVLVGVLACLHCARRCTGCAVTLYTVQRGALSVFVGVQGCVPSLCAGVLAGVQGCVLSLCVGVLAGVQGGEGLYL